MKPNWSFNADANTGHGFAIFMVSVGALRPIGLRRCLPLALGTTTKHRRLPATVEIQMHHLYIDADFKIGDAWSLPQPHFYETELSEPMMKGGVDISDLTRHASIMIALQQAGLVDWAISAAYDEFWTYLKSYFQAVPQAKPAATASLKIKDTNGKLRVSMEGLNADALAGAKVLLKDKITRTPGGVESEETSIEITLTKEPPGGA